MTSVDLKSCYDRIAHTPAIMAMHKIGAPYEPTASMFNTIEMHNTSPERHMVTQT